jgi:general secretion pathway protein G
MEASIRSGRCQQPPVSVVPTREGGFLRVGPARTPRAAAGFTLLELIVVVSIILILLSVAAPVYRNSIIRAKEAVLRDQLFMMRQLIDEYTLDKQKAPKMLEDLVEGRYLREIPRDPFTGSNTTWQVIMEDTMMAVDQTEPGIVDVKSGSDRISLDGTPYNTW